MSRRNKTNKNNNNNAIASITGPPPSHPQENVGPHRAFLSRSLDRNDQELAALVELNRSLVLVKQNILDTIGEATLLDLGEGKLVLTPDSTDLMVAPPEDHDDDDYHHHHATTKSDYWKRIEHEERQKLLPAKTEQRLLCVDFLLRLKLRRRLLNRLARRMLRLGHAMDGEDVAPPVPPKYGDPRLVLDQQAVEAAVEHWQRQQEAKTRINAQRRNVVEQALLVVKQEEQEKEETAKKDENNDENDEKEQEKEGDGEETKPDVAKSSSATAQSKLVVETLLPLIPVDEKSGDGEDPKRSNDGINANTDNKTKNKEEPAVDAMDVDSEEGDKPKEQVEKADEATAEANAKQDQPATTTQKTPDEKEQVDVVVEEQKNDDDKKDDVVMEHVERTGDNKQADQPQPVTTKDDPTAATEIKPQEDDDDVEMKDADEKQEVVAEDKKTEEGHAIKEETDEEGEPKEAVVENDKERERDTAEDGENTKEDAVKEELHITENANEKQPKMEQLPAGKAKEMANDDNAKDDADAEETAEAAKAKEAAADLLLFLSEHSPQKAVDATTATTTEKPIPESESDSDMFAASDEDKDEAAKESSGKATSEEGKEEAAKPSAEESGAKAESGDEKEEAAKLLVEKSGESKATEKPADEATKPEVKDSKDASTEEKEKPSESSSVGAAPTVGEKPSAAGEDSVNSSLFGDSKPSESNTASTSAPTSKEEKAISASETATAATGSEADAATTGAIADVPPTPLSTETPEAPAPANKEGATQEAMVPPSTIFARSSENADEDDTPGDNIDKAQGSPLQSAAEEPAEQGSKEDKQSDSKEEDTNITEDVEMKSENADATAPAKEEVQPAPVESEAPQTEADTGKEDSADKTNNSPMKKDESDDKQGADEDGTGAKKVSFAAGDVDEVYKPTVKAEECQSKSVVAKSAKEENLKNGGYDASEKASKSDKKPAPDGATSAPAKKPQEGEPTAKSPTREPIVGLPPPRELTEMERDLEALKEFVDAYEKEIDPFTGEISYKLKIEDDDALEHSSIQYGQGIGAMGRSMSLAEKAAEYKRWKTALLDRIPEAPTFEEVGMANQVFKLEERRKRLREEQEKERAAKRLKRKEEKRKKKLLKRKEDDSDYIDNSSGASDDSDDSGDDSDDDEPKKKNVGAVERKSPAKKSKDEDEDEDIMTRHVKPMSLLPIPSFYEQDLKRMRLIHADMMINSRQKHSQQKLNEVKEEYDRALNISNKILERKSLLESQHQRLLHHYHSKVTKMKNEYNMEVTVAKNQWLKQKAEHDAKRLEKLMPSRWGRTPIGSNITQSIVAQHPQGSHAHTIGICMGDLVDGVIIKSTTNITDEPFPPFKPPALHDINNSIVDSNTGEKFGDYNKRMSNNLQKEITALSVKLAASEEDRKRAWKKMAKTKGELGLAAPPGQSSISRGRNSSASRGMASGMTMAAQVATYTPQAASYATSASMQQAISDSKYSSARVKERVLNDGSVAPVAPPKTGKDGLYLRPAGRKRKGMDWDAVKGIWVPAADGNSGSGGY